MKGERLGKGGLWARKNNTARTVKPEPPPGPSKTQQTQESVRLATIRQRAIEEGHIPVSSSQRRPASP